ncbi:hypothetical protein AAFF_G00052760 [Aldrovandia affinis]|uniref:C-type lectin domain-containing protein n=1 Tax=Aldrovandia affinis TaxID=143900 RepID=A0AAD7T4U1_9TELE|nr:hypothetical protein AAFF_G00052760 [Aldrovandia affinis]
MVRKHFVSWVQNPQSMSNTSTGPSRHMRQEASAPVVSSERSICYYRWGLALAVVLCCLLLTASIVLGILYDRESRENYNPELDSLLSDYRNVSSLYQRVSAANVQLQRDNTNLTHGYARLHDENEDLTRNNTQLVGQSDNLTLANSQLRQETGNLTDANRRLRDEASDLAAYNAQLEGKNLNASCTIALLRGQNRNLTELNTQLQGQNGDLSDFNHFLEGEVERAAEHNSQLHVENHQLMCLLNSLQEEISNLTLRNVQLEWENGNLSDTNSLLRHRCKNSTQLQKEYRRILDQNTWLQDRNQNLTHQNTWLEEERKALNSENARLRLNNTNMFDQMQVLYQKYFSLDQYCPMVNHETQERQCKKCKDNWIFFQSKCYLFFGDTKTWSASRSQCQSEEADLLIVNSEEEQRFAFRTIQPTSQGEAQFWIGLTDAQTEGEWRWVDSSLVTEDLQFWHYRTNETSEPDDWKDINPLGEDCGHLSTSGPALSSWMDGPCETVYGWICEKGV